MPRYGSMRPQPVDDLSAVAKDAPTAGSKENSSSSENKENDAVETAASLGLAKILPPTGANQKFGSYPDYRKFKNKQQRELAEAAQEALVKEIADPFSVAATDDLAQTYAIDGIVTSRDMERLSIGIPLPSLALEFLFAQNVLPLSGSFYLIAGPTSVGKTAFLFEMFRWFFESRGTGFYVHTESRLPNAISLAKSILDNSETKWSDYLPMVDAPLNEEWQDHINKAIETLQNWMDGTDQKPGCGRVVPSLVAADSVASALSQSNYDNLKKRGYGDRAHPLEALQNTQFFKCVPKKLTEWPIALAAVTHEKLNINQDVGYGPPSTRFVGGGHLQFQASHVINLTKLGGTVSMPTFESNDVILKCHKNSTGPSTREIATKMKWWYVRSAKDPTDFYQVSIWDWHWSTINLLKSIMQFSSKDQKRNNGYFASMRDALRDFNFHLEIVSAGNQSNLAWSKNLNMTKNDSVSWSKLGEMLYNEPVLIKMLRSALCIRTHAVLETPAWRKLKQS